MNSKGRNIKSIGLGLILSVFDKKVKEELRREKILINFFTREIPISDLF